MGHNCWITAYRLELRKKPVVPDWLVSTYGNLYLQGSLVVLDDKGLQMVILSDAHKFQYTMHPGDTMMWCGLRY